MSASITLVVAPEVVRTDRCDGSFMVQALRPPLPSGYGYLARTEVGDLSGAFWWVVILGRRPASVGFGGVRSNSGETVLGERLRERLSNGTHALLIARADLEWVQMALRVAGLKANVHDHPRPLATSGNTSPGS